MPDARGAWIQTFTGRQFYPLDARPEDVCVEDIAHALANTARFGGHTRDFYSVAQHSVYVSNICDPKDALWGLMHDAAEAYLGDLPRPIKRSTGFEVFRQAENRLMHAICERFDLNESEPKSVRHADAVMLASEKRDLLARMQKDMGETEWLHGAAKAQPLSYHVFPIQPRIAELDFLARYRELTEVPAPFTGTPYSTLEDGGWA